MQKVKTVTANKLQPCQIFIPPIWSENLTEEEKQEYRTQMVEYEEAREWLNQFYPCVQQTIKTNRKILLVIGSETYVEQVWSMKNNYYKGKCYLEWELAQ